MAVIGGPKPKWVTRAIEPSTAVAGNVLSLPFFFASTH